MSTMSKLAVRYLRHRRSLGYGLKTEGGLLLAFARFADATALGRPLSVALALKWATLPAGRTRLYHAKRLEVIRGFARFCSALDSRTEIPSMRLLGPAHHRTVPHIYSAGQVRLLLRRAESLGPPRSLRSQTYVTILGLAACTGMRISELLRLRVTDLDLHAGTLRVARAKFSPERLLPLHPSAVAALQRYLRARGRRLAVTDHFFVGLHGRPVAKNTVHHVFRRLSQGIAGNGERAHPRIHDFRHTFATTWIAEWSRSRAPVAHHLLLLSRYLGHRHFTDTFWYVSSDPKSLADVSARFHRYFHHRGSDSTHELSPVPLARPAFLYRTSSSPAQRQSPNGGRLPRHLPPVSSFSLQPPAAIGRPA